MATILVCDDDKDIVEAISIYLEQEGHQILKAYDGQQALLVLQKNEVARVRSQLRRYTQLGAAVSCESQHIYTTGGLTVNDDQKEVQVDGEALKLTPIEYNILLLLIKNQGRVFSINQIYENIWNEEAIAADNTIAVHIRHIREKIEINPKEPRYLKVVWGLGYKIEKL